MPEGIDERTLDRLEREHETGLTSQEILDVLLAAGVRFSEATLRKWVQVGLLPRSVRVGQKGKHRGSQGLYPATVIRQILQIRRMMAEDLTIEQIQREYLFVRGDIEELERTLRRIFDSLEEASGRRDAPAIAQDVSTARGLATQLVTKIESIEARIAARAHLRKTAAS